MAMELEDCCQLAMLLSLLLLIVAVKCKRKVNVGAGLNDVRKHSE